MTGFTNRCLQTGHLSSDSIARNSTQIDRLTRGAGVRTAVPATSSGGNGNRTGSRGKRSQRSSCKRRLRVARSGASCAFYRLERSVCVVVDSPDGFPPSSSSVTLSPSQPSAVCGGTRSVNRAHAFLLQGSLLDSAVVLGRLINERTNP